MSAPLERYRPRSIAMMTPLHDGSGVVLHLDTKLYFTLNETAVAVWRALADRDGQTVQEIAERLVESFDVALPVALADAATILDELFAEGLLEKSA